LLGKLQACCIQNGLAGLDGLFFALCHKGLGTIR
jgi:hypothetical protein